MKIRQLQVLVLILLFTSFISNAQQSAYAIHSIPGTIFLKNYDIGGEGVAFHEAGSNHCGFHRGTDMVGLEAADGDTVVSCIHKEEWLEYTMNSVLNGNYDITIRYSSIYNGTINVRLIRASGDTVLLATFNSTSTSSWSNYDTIIKTNVTINGGTDNILRVEYPTSSGAEWVCNMNWISFTSTVTGISDRKFQPVIKYRSDIKTLILENTALNDILSIYNLTGQREYCLTNCKNNVNVSFLNPGLYFAIINNGNDQQTIKFVVNK